MIEQSLSQTPAVYEIPVLEQDSRLRQFIALQHDVLLILGPRRHPPVSARASNSNTSIAIQTSQGFSTLTSEDYAKATQVLRPDIVIGMSDYEYSKIPGAKRTEKMGDRTLSWTREMITALSNSENCASSIAFFAPVLPIDRELQSYYLDALEDDLQEHTCGWAIHDPTSIDTIPRRMRPLPTLCLGEPGSPQNLLDQISLGIDICTVPFVGECTDAGIALTFWFPGGQGSESTAPLPLGIDMWSTLHAYDLSPISKGCQCYTCMNHHRAYVRHLLDAKEMLAWVLLQIHNCHVMDLFFTAVRQCIADGSFEGGTELFKKRHERELPARSGQGPR